MKYKTTITWLYRLILALYKLYCDCDSPMVKVSRRSFYNSLDMGARIVNDAIPALENNQITLITEISNNLYSRRTSTWPLFIIWFCLLAPKLTYVLYAHTSGNSGPLPVSSTIWSVIYNQKAKLLLNNRSWLKPHFQSGSVGQEWVQISA